MKKLFAIFATGFLLASTAFAQYGYVPPPMILGYGPQGGGYGYGGAPVMAGGGSNPCVAGGALLGGAINSRGSSYPGHDMLIGGVVGALAGKLASSTICPEYEPRQVVVQGQAMQVSHQVVERRTVIPTCKINTGGAIYTFNAVNGTKIGPRECEQYLKKEIPLPQESEMSIVP